MKKHILEIIVSLFLSLIILGIGLYIIEPDIIAFFMFTFFMFILSIIFCIIFERKPLIRRTFKILSISGLISSVYLSTIFYIIASRIESGI